jgi:hypothetical protein
MMMTPRIREQARSHRFDACSRFRVGCKPVGDVRGYEGSEYDRFSYINGE